MTDVVIKIVQVEADFKVIYWDYRRKIDKFLIYLLYGHTIYSISVPDVYKTSYKMQFPFFICNSIATLRSTKNKRMCFIKIKVKRSCHFWSILSLHHSTFTKKVDIGIQNLISGKLIPLNNNLSTGTFIHF